MRRLSRERRAQILALLVEGISLRSMTRITGASINTVTELLADAGEACLAYHDQTVRGLSARGESRDSEIDTMGVMYYTCKYGDGCGSFASTVRIAPKDSASGMARAT